MKLEKEWLAGLENTKSSSPTWLPKIDLIRRKTREKVEPIFVGDAYPEFHHIPRTLLRDSEIKLTPPSYRLYMSDLSPSAPFFNSVRIQIRLPSPQNSA